MARITAHLDVPTDARIAFDHVADFTTTVDWDDSITEATRLDTGDIGLGSCFRVQLKLGLTTVPLEYVITDHTPPSGSEPGRVVLTTKGPLHRGEDDVRFRATDDGTHVTWKARFALRGPGLLLDPVLGIGFRRTAAAAVAGLERSLTELADR
jgi:hypothetical protein